MASAASSAASTSGVGRAVFGAGEDDALDAGLAAAAHEVVLELEVAYVCDHVRGERVVGHRQDRRADAHVAAEMDGDFCQALALPEQVGAREVGGDVAVAETEPGRAVQLRDGVEDGEGVACEAPAGLAIVEACERVGDGVEVGADAQAEVREVVAGVDDRP